MSSKKTGNENIINILESQRRAEQAEGPVQIDPAPKIFQHNDKHYEYNINNPSEQILPICSITEIYFNKPRI